MNRPTSPTTQLLDLLGRRWALRILWELTEGPFPFGELQSRCDGMSTSVLTQRLSELRDAGLIETRDGTGYALTAPGGRLLERLRFFDDWASEWQEHRRRSTRAARGKATKEGIDDATQPPACAAPGRRASRPRPLRARDPVAGRGRAARPR